MHKFAGLVVLSVFLHAVPAPTQEVAGDWIGQLNGGFTVRIHLEKNAAGYSGHLTNPSGNETDFDQVTVRWQRTCILQSTSSTLATMASGMRRKGWNGSLTFQQVYPLILKRGAAADLAPHEHKRPQEAAIMAQTQSLCGAGCPNSTIQPAITSLPER